MATPNLDGFLNDVNRFLKVKDGNRLRDFLPIEPPLPAEYNSMIKEIRDAYSTDLESRLEKKFETVLPEYDFFAEGTNAAGAWGSFHTFLIQYLSFIRDVNAEKLIETHEMIKSLLTYVYFRFQKPNC
jgi:nuclear mRNA export protein PCID2/THP1